MTPVQATGQHGAAGAACRGAGRRKLQAAHGVEVVLPRLDDAGDAIEVGGAEGARDVETGGRHVGEEVAHAVQRPDPPAPRRQRGDLLRDGGLGARRERAEAVHHAGGGCGGARFVLLVVRLEQLAACLSDEMRDSGEHPGVG